MTQATTFVDGLGVLTSLMKAAPELDGVQVFTKIPDNLSQFLPCLVITRTGGSSLSPRFQSDFFVHFQVWSDKTVDYPNDPFEAAYNLGLTVCRVLFRCKEEQTLALDNDGHVMGWIADWRESSGLQDFTDPDLPHIGRYVAVYDLKIRNRRPNSA